MSEERRSAIAIFLSILVIFTWTSVFQTPTAPQVVPPQTATPPVVANAPAEKPVTIITNPVEGSAPLVAADQTEPVVAAKTVSAADYRNAETITIESDLYIAKVGLLGGRLLSFQLKNYKKEAGGKELVEMVKTEGKYLPLGLTTESASDEYSLYTIRGVSTGTDLSQKSFLLNAGEKLSFSLLGTLPDGNQSTKNFSFDADSYLFTLSTELARPSADGSSLKIHWNTYLPEAFFKGRYNFKTLFHRKDTGGISRDQLDGSNKILQSSSDLSGMGDSYFMATILSPDGVRNVNQQVEKQADGGSLIEMSIAGEPQKGNFQIYVGPKDPKVLTEVGHDLYRAIDLGWFAFVGQPILKLIEFFYSIMGNYGLAIILVTILMKLLLLPLTKKSFLSMQAMQKIQPQVVALRERIKDPAVVQQEMLKIYQQNGVNPLGGCLPMILQMPIFLGMYNALQSSIYLRHADYALWINDLSMPENLVIFGIPVPVMILLMGGSMFLQTVTMPSTADANQKKIMYMMPVMFTVMFIIMPFPSGLVLYWLVNNIMSIIQQYALRTERNIQALPATLVSGLVVFAIGYILTLL